MNAPPTKASGLSCGLKNSPLNHLFKGMAEDTVESCLPACDENFVANRDQALEQFIKSASTITNPSLEVKANPNDFKKWEQTYLVQERAKNESQMECHIISRKTGTPVSLDCLNKNKDKSRRLLKAEQDYRLFLDSVTLANLQTNFLNAGYSQKMFCLIHRYNAFEDVFKINENSRMLSENKMAAVKDLLLKKAGLISDPNTKPSLAWLCEAYRSGKLIPILFSNAISKCI